MPNTVELSLISKNGRNSCVNCSMQFDQDALMLPTTRLTNVTIAVPVEVDGAMHTGVGGLVQPIQLEQISVRDLLHEIYGLPFHKNEELPVCSGCMNNLANLYMAHKNLAKLRNETSLMTEYFSTVKKVLTQFVRSHTNTKSPNAQSGRKVRAQNTSTSSSKVTSEAFTVSVGRNNTSFDDKSGSQYTTSPALTKRTKIAPTSCSSSRKRLPSSQAAVPVSAHTNQNTEIEVPKTGPPYRCPHCMKLYRTPNSYRNHIYLVHTTLPAEHSLCLACGACNVEFANEYLLQQHQIEVHGVKEDSVAVEINCERPNQWTAVSTGLGSRVVALCVDLDAGDCRYFGCYFTGKTKEAAVSHYVALHARCAADIEQARNESKGNLQFTVSEEEFAKLEETGCWNSPNDINNVTDNTDIKKKTRNVVRRARRRINSSSNEILGIKSEITSEDASHPSNEFPAEILGIKAEAIYENENDDEMFDENPSETAAEVQELNNSDQVNEDNMNTLSISFPTVVLEFAVKDGRCPYCTRKFQSGPADNWRTLRAHVREAHLSSLNEHIYNSNKKSARAIKRPEPQEQQWRTKKSKT